MPAFTLPIPWLMPICGAVAFIYGSVGLGGGSSYLAAMALLGVDYALMPQVALGLNLIVASGGSWHYYRAGHYKSRLFVPLVLASMPAAFLASRLPLSREVFQGVLGALLLLAAVRMLAHRQAPNTDPLDAGPQHERAPSDVPPRRGVAFLLGLGGILGTVAGITGIGGGIYLVPSLLAMGLTNTKGAAAISAPFIALNSVAGLLGRIIFTQLVMPWRSFAALGLTVLIAGQIGARLGARRLSGQRVRQIFGFIVGTVAIRLLWRTVFG